MRIPRKLNEQARMNARVHNMQDIADTILEIKNQGEDVRHEHRDNYSSVQLSSSHALVDDAGFHIRGFDA